MGAPTQANSSGKGQMSFQPPDGSKVTTPATSAQPSMGQPNQYPNTVGGWDNASIQTPTGGKGKGG